MFSLIITIISIALVAALAVATIYYGGESFKNNGVKAAAARVVNGGSQINGAVEAFKATTGTVPSSLDDLVTSKFLSVIPAGVWAVQTDYVVATGLSVEQCTEANRQLNITVTPSCTDPLASGISACCSS